MENKKNIIIRIQDYLASVAGQTLLNYLYSWGAAIVILGALFKLTHIDGANLMLFVGMGTEVVVFFISGFDRQFDTSDEDGGKEVGNGPIIIGGGSPMGAVSVNGENNATVDPDVLAAAQTAANGPIVIGGGYMGGPVVTGGPIVTGGPMVAGAPISTGNQAAVSYNGGESAGNVAQAVYSDGGSQPVVVGGAQPMAAPVVTGGGTVNLSEVEQATQDYIEQLKTLSESFDHIAQQSSKLEDSADEVERLSRNLTSINTIYEMHLKSLGSQIGNIDQVNDQTRKMAEQIEELNRVYERMLESMTVNMKLNRGTSDMTAANEKE